MARFKFPSAAMKAASKKAAPGGDMLTPGDEPDPKATLKKAHPGFQALVKAGIPAGALANAARNASPAAKARNPRLQRVK